MAQSKHSTANDPELSDLELGQVSGGGLVRRVAGAIGDFFGDVFCRDTIGHRENVDGKPCVLFEDNSATITPIPPQ